MIDDLVDIMPTLCHVTQFNSLTEFPTLVRTNRKFDVAC